MSILIIKRTGLTSFDIQTQSISKILYISHFTYLSLILEPLYFQTWVENEEVCPGQIVYEKCFIMLNPRRDEGRAVTLTRV